MRGREAGPPHVAPAACFPANLPTYPNLAPLPLPAKQYRYTHSVIRCEFEPTADNAGTGWVTEAGVGAYQLRVGQPPGSSEPLVSLDPGLAPPEGFEVALWEAKGHDPAVPEGKTFARLAVAEVGLSGEAGGAGPRRARVQASSRRARAGCQLHRPPLIRPGGVRCVRLKQPALSRRWRWLQRRRR